MTMNVTPRWIKTFTLASALIASQAAWAQTGEELVTFLTAGKDDAAKLTNAYFTPAVEGISYGLNGGWYTTAKAHKTLGFDFSLSLNAVGIPSSKNFFSPNDLGLQTVTLVNSTDGKAPTMVGPDQKNTYALKANPSTTFDGPGGLDFKGNIGVSGVVMPTATLGIGIYKNTDLKIRWMPEIKPGESRIKLIGFGVMHDVKQHIPGIKYLPFDLSMVVGYTRVSGATNVSGKFDSGTDSRPQEVNYVFNAWLVQALISKKISVVTFYGGIGYNTVKATTDITGTYVIPEIGQTLVDPIAMSFKNNSLRLNGGIRLKFGPIFFNGEYIIQEYSTYSLGFGFAVR